jgi:hypothetical protein
MKIDNNNKFAYRAFLVCNTFANAMLGNGVLDQNFAKLLIDEENGATFNSQMTMYFDALDEQFSELYGNDPEWIWDFLEMEEVAEISPEQLEKDYFTYCLDTEEDGGKILNFHL